ncbi:MAG: hypothetical protein SPJ83_03945 [Helicobacter sp.]|uniref:Uncharacterized protein n=1 Tax=Helicobacter bilis TaxID=37372 RepID=A0A1Q2LH87_9HELI|nr:MULTISPECIES: hypothetical protein [Helicobacter]AQQ59836.1 hypothetical protein XJ32_06790 [Helicobacter bilis]MDY5821938.1 hypothetical protein [Helicobacter sp.]
MALNTIGNMTYINQASSATSALHANNMPHQTPLNHAIFHEQMQKVEEVRPAEEMHKTDDREGSAKREFDEKEEKKEEESKDFQEQMENAAITPKKKKDERVITEDEMLMRPETHLLDVKG